MRWLALFGLGGALFLTACDDMTADRAGDPTNRPAVRSDTAATPSTATDRTTVLKPPAVDAVDRALDNDGATTRDADNSGVNVRDREDDAVTPLDQSNAQADIDITAKIRSRILDAEDLSLNADNVKIITQDGKVTLRGPVKSADEREAIMRIATEIAGEGNIVNQLDVEANP